MRAAADIFPDMSGSEFRLSAPFEFHPHPAPIPPTNPNTCHTIALGIGGVLAAFVLGVIVVFAAL